MSHKKDVTPEMVAGNLTYKEITQKYGISRRIIARNRAKYGIKPEQVRPNKPCFVPKSALLLGKTVKQIAEEHGVSMPTVYKYYRVHNLTPPMKALVEETLSGGTHLHIPCPRCGSVVWKMVSENGVYYCTKPTPNDPLGFSRCWYHLNLSGGVA